MVDALNYEIRDVSPPGALTLELVVDGEVVGRSFATPQMLADLHAQFGMDREAVAAELHRALTDALKTQRQFVRISDLREDPDRQLRFVARFTHRLQDRISIGVVWYDVETSTTGSETVPAIVRNELRQQVHRHLTSAGTDARGLVDVNE